MFGLTPLLGGPIEDRRLDTRFLADLVVSNVLVPKYNARRWISPMIPRKWNRFVGLISGILTWHKPAAQRVAHGDWKQAAKALGVLIVDDRAR